MLTMSLVGNSGFFGDFGAATKKSTAKRLQAALAALGRVAGSPSLKAIKADGAIGPSTTAAVNLAFTKHIGSGQAPAQYRTGQLSLAFVKANAAALADLIEAEVRRRGGTASAPQKAATAITATKAALVAKAAAAATPHNVPFSKDAAKRLQAALVVLGKIAGSATLKAVKVDGVPGAKTVAAVNLAFTKHLGAGQAPAQYRTGALSLDFVKANVAALASLIETEIKRRGGTPASAATVSKSQPKAKGSAIAAANKALAAKKKADAAAAKKAAALAKRTALKKQAADERAAAANVRSYNPAAAASLDARAAADEAAAEGANAEAVAAATDESAAASETQVAANEADEIATTARDVATQAVQAMTPSAASSSSGDDSGGGSASSGGGGPTEASMIPSMDSGSFLNKYKYPLIGGVALLGLLAVMTSQRPKTATNAKPPTKPLAPMNGTRRRHARGRR